MEPAFDDLHDGSLIRVVRPDGEHVGVMHVARLPDPPRFGVIVQFGPSAQTKHAPPPPTSDQGYVATGHSGLPVHKLTLEELRGIERTDNLEVPFALTALQT